MINKTLISMQENNWIDSSFKEELIEFTRANTIQRERELQVSRSKGKTQQDLDTDRKRIDRDRDKSSAVSNPWSKVIIVRTQNDGKIRLIPTSDFEQGRHELLYGNVSGQPPKPEVTPNVAQEIASQDGFEPSKTSNRLLGVQQRKKQSKEQIIRSDHYDYPKDGVEKTDSTSSYPDWDHSVDSLSQGISLVANSTGGRQVDIPTIRQFFGQSSTLMDASIRAFQQIGSLIKGQLSITTPEQAYPVAGPWTEITSGMDIPNTDIMIQDNEGNVYYTAFVYDKTKITDGLEATVLFSFSLSKTLNQLESEEKTKKSLDALIKKISDKIMSFNKDNGIQKKYLLSNSEDFKNEMIADFEKIFEISDVFEEEITIESLTGNEKFGGNPPGAANALISSSKDGTNLRFSPLNKTTIRRLLGETELKVKLGSSQDESPFDEMFNLLVSSKTPDLPQIKEFFDILEEVNDAKIYFESFMSQQESKLVGLLEFFNLKCESVVIKNINLDAVGSIGSGDFNTVNVGDKTYYIGVEKEVPFYDSSALKLEDVSSLFNINEEKRNYKKEYNEYHGKPEQIKRRSSRNGARRKLEKEGRVSQGDGKDVDHKDRNPLNNGNGNLRVRSRSSNRGDNKDNIKEEHGAGDEGTIELLLKYLEDTPYMTIPKHLLDKRKNK